MGLLDKLKKALDEPVKLSETEKEKFTTFFKLQRDWLNETETEIMELDRDEAYRRAEILSTMLDAAAQKFGDPAHTVKKTVETKPEPQQEPQPIEKKLQPLNKRGRRPVNLDGATIIVEPEDPDRFRRETTKPTVEQFQEWINGLPASSRDIATTKLDCVKQFPKLGADIICPDCSKAAFVQCVRNEDPSFTDSITEFMKAQTR